MKTIWMVILWIGVIGSVVGDLLLNLVGVSVNIYSSDTGLAYRVVYKLISFGFTLLPLLMYEEKQAAETSRRQLSFLKSIGLYLIAYCASIPVLALVELCCSPGLTLLQSIIGYLILAFSVMSKVLVIYAVIIVTGQELGYCGHKGCEK